MLSTLSLQGPAGGQLGGPAGGPAGGRAASRAPRAGPPRFCPLVVSGTRCILRRPLGGGPGEWMGGLWGQGVSPGVELGGAVRGFTHDAVPSVKGQENPT